MLKRTYITDDVKAHIIELRKQGLSVTSIAREIHASTPDVSEILEDAGMMKRTPGRPKTIITDDMKVKIVDMYKAGKAITIIAGEIHSNATTIRNILEDAGVEIRTGGYRAKDMTPEIEQQILDLYESGMPITNVARMVHLREEKISALLKAKGVKLRPGKKTIHITEDIKQQILVMRWKGMSMVRIARWLHTSEDVIRDVLVKENAFDVDDDEPKYTYMSYEDFEKMEFEKSLK